MEPPKNEGPNSSLQRRGRFPLWLPCEPRHFRPGGPSFRRGSWAPGGEFAAEGPEPTDRRLRAAGDLHHRHPRGASCRCRGFLVWGEAPIVLGGVRREPIGSQPTLGGGGGCAILRHTQLLDVGWDRDRGGSEVGEMLQKGTVWLPCLFCPVAVKRNPRGRLFVNGVGKMGAGRDMQERYVPSHPFHMEPDVRDPVPVKGKWCKPGPPDVRFHVSHSFREAFRCEQPVLSFGQCVCNRLT